MSNVLLIYKILYLTAKISIVDIKKTTVDRDSHIQKAILDKIPLQLDQKPCLVDTHLRGDSRHTTWRLSPNPCRLSPTANNCFKYVIVKYLQTNFQRGTLKKISNLRDRQFSYHHPKIRSGYFNRIPSHP
jgi:hypothetical protein